MDEQAGSSDEALQEELGSRLRDLRLNRNESQQELARRAGVGKATLQRLEEGRSGTIVTLLRVLRALDLDNLDALVPAVERSPLAEARGERQARVRARGRSAPKRPPGGWRWGDEEGPAPRSNSGAPRSAPSPWPSISGSPRSSTTRTSPPPRSSWRRCACPRFPAASTASLSSGKLPSTGCRGCWPTRSRIASATR